MKDVTLFGTLSIYEINGHVTIRITEASAKSKLREEHCRTLLKS